MREQNRDFSLALVTGASSGIGAALARLLAAKGIPLLLAGRDKERLNALAAELASQAPIELFPGDISNPDDRRSLIAIIQQKAPDLVVNSAGFGLYGEALSYETADQLAVVDLDARTLLEVTLEASRTLITQGKEGVVMNISSASDFIVFPGLAVYAAVKAFVTMVSQSLDAELRGKGVRILAACPGVVRTQFRKRASGQAAAPSGPVSMDVGYAAEQIWRQIARRKPLHYFGLATRFMLFLARIAPKKLVAKILAKQIHSLNSRV